MRHKIPPAAIVSLVLLSALNAWLLNTLFSVAVPETAPSPPRDTTGSISKPDFMRVSQMPLANYGQILSRPVFFKTRSPYVAVSSITATVAPPVTAIPDPVLSVAGVFIAGDTKKAYIVRQSDPKGTWVTEGDNILGWTVGIINPKGIELQHNSRALEFTIYPSK